MSTQLNPGCFAASAVFTRAYQSKYATLFAKEAPVLDLGCGTGIFLTLLREQGISALGVDAFSSAVAECHAQGLDVVESDILSFLASTSLRFGGALCSHVIEHLSVAQAEEMIDQIARVLLPGAIVVIITPDPADLLVMGEYFWLDSTHVRPYPRRLCEHLLKTRGFEILDSGNDPETKLRMPRRNPRSALRHLLARLRFGNRYGCGDTFVVARRRDPLTIEN